MKLADKISRALMMWVNPNWQHLFLPNYYLMEYECDACLVTRSNIVTEYEIKISRSDFFADFSKQRYESNKHEKLKAGKLGRNYFYFVVPKDLVTLDEVPNHCGLIYYETKSGFPNFSIVRKAPRLTKDKYFENFNNLVELNQTLRYKVSNYQAKLKRIEYERRLQKSTIQL